MKFIILFINVIFTFSQLINAEPKVLDSRYTLELVGANPDIVTPVGMCIDETGTLLIIESHTHHPKGKQPFPHDRIRSLKDTDGDGKPETWGTFFEGSKMTMSIRKGKNGWIYVATRAKIFRIKDSNNDGKADLEENLIDLDTEATYPHNGLCGLLFDKEGKLYFGIGENFAKDYKLVGKNNTLLGGGEGGNVYRCNADGSELEFVATGVWNPFAMCFDPQGRLFCVDNDPDSAPPCRLLEIKETADYGFQMRYGRSGTHPLQAWKGEIPGTMGMLYGTGEAPCDVYPFHGQLLVSSWGHNRIESYTYESSGTSLKAKMKIIVQGDNMFRPVDFAEDKNGNLYFTDWVDRSYPVHGKGKVWKLSYKPGKNEPVFPQLSNQEKEIREIAQGKKNAFDSVNLKDANTMQAAIAQLAKRNDLSSISLKDKSDLQRFAVLSARKWRIFANLDDKDKVKELVDLSLKDSSSDIRFLGVRLVADYMLKDYKTSLEKLLSNKGNSPALFKAICAAVSYLETGKVARGKNTDHSMTIMLKMLRSKNSSEDIKRIILQNLSLDQKKVSLNELSGFLQSENTELRREAVRLIAFANDEKKNDILIKVASNTEEDDNIRADAIMGLMSSQNKFSSLLKELEGKSALMASKEKYIKKSPNKEISTHPASNDLKAWTGIISEKKGDPNSGWRIFFGPNGGQCSSCHMYNGKGAKIGPDLSTLSMTEERILESILLPNKEIGPLYEMWNIELKNGSSRVGNPHGEKGKFNTFTDMQGKGFQIEKSKIKKMTPLGTSMMPPGLEKLMTYQELRDLIALLMQK